MIGIIRIDSRKIRRKFVLLVLIYVFPLYTILVEAPLKWPGWDLLKKNSVVYQSK